MHFRITKDDLPDGETLVTVRRQPDDHTAGRFKLPDIHGLRLDCMTGGYQQLVGRNFLFGYVFCTSLVDGGIGHSCTHGPAPHDIKVCILESDNKPQVFRHLCTLAQCPDHTDGDYAGGTLCAECGREYSTDGEGWTLDDPAFAGLDIENSIGDALEDFPNLCASCVAAKLRERTAAQ